MAALPLKRRLNLILLPFIPISIWLGVINFNPMVVLVLTILTIIPITTYIARSTQQLSMRTSTIAGSLLNATFGNIIEFMIAILAIRAGLIEMVKAFINRLHNLEHPPAHRPQHPVWRFPVSRADFQ